MGPPSQPNSPNDYFQEIGRRAHAYPLPPADFDPLSATSAHLDKHGLPAQPHQLSEPELFHHWKLMLGPPFKPVAPEFPKQGSLLPPLVHQFDHGRGRSAGAVHHIENSRNWSGAYIRPTSLYRFVYVAGGWRVPQVSVPAVLPDGAVPGDDEYRSSTWIGIDGHRRYPKSSLPQIGTSQTVKVVGGKQTVTTGAWWQWWSQDDQFPPQARHNPPVPIPNFPVAVGDEILASLTVQSADEVRFHIKNQTTGLFTNFLVVAPGPILALGSTAEWIMERPTVLGESRLYPMPSYTDVVFHHCVAKSVPEVGGAAMTHTLDGARLIRMYEVFPNPHRTAFVSQPQKTSNRSARVFYREAGSAG